jgi:hypothetical protein
MDDSSIQENNLNNVYGCTSVKHLVQALGSKSYILGSCVFLMHGSSTADQV